MRELEDHKWWPAWLRNFQTDFVGFMSVFFNVYEPIKNYWKTIGYKPTRIIDLCSGSGLPAKKIGRDPTINAEVILTDKFPREIPQHQHLLYFPGSWDVRQMKYSRQNCYTMFNAFHHFTDAEKVNIVTEMRKAGCRAYIVEVLQPDPFNAFKIFLAATIGCVLFTPIVQPFSLSRLFFTYVVPINIPTIAWDGMVSVVKSRTLWQYQELFKEFGDQVRVLRLGNCLYPLILIEVLPDEDLDSDLEFQQAPHNYRKRRKHNILVYYS